MKKIIALALLAASASASAQWSVQLHGVSKHTGDRVYNEQNLGVSLRYTDTQELSYQAGVYRNSYNLNTVFAAVNYTPVKVGPVRLGAFAGVGTGYKLPIMAGAMAVVDLGRVNLTFRGVPKIGRGTDAVIAMEVGFTY